MRRPRPRAAWAPVRVPGPPLRPTLVVLVVLVVLVATLSGCDLVLQPTPSGTDLTPPSIAATAAATPEDGETGEPPATDAATPTTSPAATASATPEPELSLDLPAVRDERRVRVAVAPDLPADADGRIMVTVTNLSDTRLDEIVLRWPTELADVLFLAPFMATDERIRDGGDPLVQAWTKWVDGPGERGEPSGTTSLGYGPMDPRMELQIPLFVTRRASRPVEFDLQLLVGEALLALEDGSPAVRRVAVP